MDANRNQQLYAKGEVVAYYAEADWIFPAERYLFSKYVPDGAHLLDVGVGGGRTTPLLSARAKRYLGIDYSEAMVAECRKRFPDLEFMVADATNLQRIADASFDIAIFSFNGIDYIPSDEARIECLRELARVTRANGHVIISSHNARALGSFPDYAGADTARVLWRTARAFWSFFRISSRTLRTRAFWDGSGYIMDPVHGGLRTHVSTPKSIAGDCSAAGLRVVEEVGHFYPKLVPAWLNPWNNYVLQRAD